MKLYITTLIFLICLVGIVYSDIPNKSKRDPVIACRTTEKIVLDGELTEKVWNCPPVTDFIQRNPNEGKPATEKTECWIAYDDDYIYVAAKLYDSSPDSIVTRISRHDYMNETDFFAVVFDSYYDRRTGFYFIANPSGSKLDGQFSNDSWGDDSWNAVWDYKAKIQKDGWYVEMKIPFSQLRFNKADEMIWGVNFQRTIQRKNEEDLYSPVSKSDGAFISLCADLKGLKGIQPKQRLEVLPYIVSKAQYLIHDDKDPFYKKNQYKATVGTDFKIGLGSNLTIDGTINPDFGQVEVDPAVINLSAFETFYQEKRPFFIEGNNIFDFGTGGSNNNWNFNFSNPQFFYSRRIGKSPRGDVSHEGFVDYPNQTQIIGAAKLSGKIGNDWSLGFLSALTERTYAQIDSEGTRFEEEIEPSTFFGVARVQKEFDKGFSSLGFISTLTKRELRTESLKDVYSDLATTFGIDGFTHLDQEREYVLTYFLAGSYIKGSKNYIISLQKSPMRFLQRPDANFMKLDSSIISLSGFSSRITLNKQKGNFYINAGFGIISPGFEFNDMGFLFGADKINSHLVLGYRWFESDGLFRQKQVYFATYRTYSFDGLKISDGYFAMGNFQFTNYYGINFQVSYNPQSYTLTHTRGGPAALKPAEYGSELSIYSDNRKPLTFDFETYYFGDVNGGKYVGCHSNISWKVNSALNFSIGPSYEDANETLQWINSFSDKNAINTFGNRYVFANMKQKTISLDFRLNWSFTPNISVQLYLQQLLSIGNFSGFKELSKSKSLDYRIYGTDNSVISYDETNKIYNVIPDNNFPNNTLSFDNPDFNYKSLRGSLIVRWEYLPGSVLFFVWTRGQENFYNPGVLSLNRDMKDLWNEQANNLFVIKLNYWFNL